MSNAINKSPSPLMWVTAIALILFSGVGIAAFMGWLPTSFGNPGDEPVAVVAPKPAHKAQPQLAKHEATKAVCAECGVVESVTAIKVAGKGTGIGIAGGAVVGGLLGHQVGGGRGKDVATVAGAVGGAVAGNEIEKNVASTTTYEIRVHFDDGSSRVYNESNPPQWQSGDRVRVVNGSILSDG